jgi:hypothetical protein
VWEGERGGRVYGLTFLNRKATPENPARLSIASLTARILCERHNSQLSKLDTEAAKLFRGLERLRAGEENGESVAANTYINGDRVERWMLKTLLNGAYSGNFPVPFVRSFAGQLPPDEVLQVIYRGAPFAAGEGLYMGLAPALVNHEVFQLEVVGHQTGIVGLRVWMFGTLFTLVLSKERESFPELDRASYRPRRIVTANTRNSILFSWDGESSGQVFQIARSPTRPE